MADNPGSSPQAEILFAHFLAGLPGKRAHLGSHAGVWLRHQGILVHGKLKPWIIERSYLLRIVDGNYVALQQPQPYDDDDSFLDRVSP